MYLCERRDTICYAYKNIISVASARDDMQMFAGKNMFVA